MLMVDAPIGVSAETDDTNRSQEITGRVQRDGPWLVDEHGRIVLLRGANQVWKGEPWVAPVAPGAGVCTVARCRSRSLIPSL